MSEYMLPIINKIIHIGRYTGLDVYKLHIGIKREFSCQEFLIVERGFNDSTLKQSTLYYYDSDLKTQRILDYVRENYSKMMNIIAKI